MSEKTELEQEEQVTISTGNSDVDAKLEGGIPVGSLTLVEGPSASGKSVLTQQLTWGSLGARYKVLVYTSERTVSSHVRQMESLGLDVLDFLLLGRLKVFPIHRVGELDQSLLLRALVADMGNRDAYDLIMVDSLTPMVTASSVVDIIAFFEDCHGLCSQGKTIVITLHPYSIDESARERIRSACDANLNLRIESVMDQLVNVMEVMKLSGAPRNTGNVLSFVVEPGIGLRSIPLAYAKV